KRQDRARLDTARTTGRTVASDPKWRRSTTRLPMKPFAPMTPITGTASPIGLPPRVALFPVVEPRHPHRRAMPVAMLDEPNALENILPGEHRRGMPAHESEDIAQLFDETLMEIGGCAAGHRSFVFPRDVAQARCRRVAGVRKADVDGVSLVDDPAQPTV